MLIVSPLNEVHLEDAAALVSSRYRHLREHEPLLPHRYEEVSNLLPLLQDIQAAGPGVAAFQGGRLVGFLAGWPMLDFRGKRSVFSPEWANAADLKDSQYICEEMYGQLAAEWVADKFAAHYIGLFANDRNAIGAWHWLGFGMIAVDAIRGLHPIKDVDIQIDIQRARSQDLERILKLNDGLRQYMKGSPAFFIAEKFNEDYFREWLENPGKVIWLASINEEPVAFMRMGPANDDVCTIIYDEKTTSIVVTEPEKVDTELRISLNRADNDFECFFHCPLMAWEEVQPEVMENPFGALLGAMFLSEHLVQ